MNNGAISANVLGILSSVTLGIVLSLSTPAYAESAVNKASSIELAFNTTNDKRWNKPLANTIETTDYASQAAVEALNKAMEKVSMRLEEQLENEIARKLEHAMQ